MLSSLWFWFHTKITFMLLRYCPLNLHLPFNNSWLWDCQDKQIRFISFAHLSNPCISSIVRVQFPTPLHSLVSSNKLHWILE